MNDREIVVYFPERSRRFIFSVKPTQAPVSKINISLCLGKRNMKNCHWIFKNLVTRHKVFGKFLLNMSKLNGVVKEMLSY
jgi:hypothetical protein